MNTLASQLPLPFPFSAFFAKHPEAHFAEWAAFSAVQASFFFAM